MEKNIQLQRIESVLDGSTGILYLMFLGSEKYIGQLQGPLVKSGFYRKKENVNQTFYRLMKKNADGFFLKFIREENKAGKPKVYTANYEPLFLTLQDVVSEIDENILKKVIETFSFLNYDFLKHLLNDKKAQHKRLKWRIVLARYLQFLVASCFIPYLFKTSETISDEEREKLNPLFSFVFDKHKATTKNPLNLADIIEKFMSKNNLSEKVVASEIIKKFQIVSIKLVFGKQTGDIMKATSTITNTLTSSL